MYVREEQEMACLSSSDQQSKKMIRMKSSGGLTTRRTTSPLTIDGDDDDDALFAFQAKEEEITKKKMEVKGRVEAQLNRFHQETKKLAEIRCDLEALEDPSWKEGLVVRKRVDLVNKELKTMAQNCQKKEKEYREAIDAFNDKNKEKAQLITKLTELLSESETVRMKKLQELNEKIKPFVKS
ncbi:hypothetical protein R6Q59_014813 [Mikania micrantha]